MMEWAWLPADAERAIYREGATEALLYDLLIGKELDAIRAVGDALPGADDADD